MGLEADPDVGFSQNLPFDTSQENGRNVPGAAYHRRPLVAVHRQICSPQVRTGSYLGSRRPDRVLQL